MSLIGTFSCTPRTLSIMSSSPALILSMSSSSSSLLPWLGIFKSWVRVPLSPVSLPFHCCFSLLHFLPFCGLSSNVLLGEILLLLLLVNISNAFLEEVSNITISLLTVFHSSNVCSFSESNESGWWFSWQKRESEESWNQWIWRVLMMGRNLDGGLLDRSGILSF